MVIWPYHVSIIFNHWVNLKLALRFHALLIVTIYSHVSPFASTFPWNKRSSHQGKEEVACIVSKPLVSCLWGCGESVNPQKLNIQRVQGALSRSMKDSGLRVPISKEENEIIRTLYQTVWFSQNVDMNFATHFLKYRIMPKVSVQRQTVSSFWAVQIPGSWIYMYANAYWPHLPVEYSLCPQVPIAKCWWDAISHIRLLRRNIWNISPPPPPKKENTQKKIPCLYSQQFENGNGYL